MWLKLIKIIFINYNIFKKIFILIIRFFKDLLPQNLRLENYQNNVRKKCFFNLFLINRI